MAEPLDIPFLDSPTEQAEPGPGPKPVVTPFTQFTQEMEGLAKKNNPFFGTPAYDVPIVPRSQTRRYEGQEMGYMYGIDNEDFYGQRQSGLEKIGNGLLKLAGYTATKTLSGVGYLGGLINPGNWFSEDGYLTAAADNTFSQVFNNLEDKIRDEWAPTFNEASDREKGFWGRAFTDMDFWTEDFVDGLAFMASAYVPGGILTKLGTGAKIAKGLSTMRIGSEAASAIVSGVETAPNYLRQAATLSSKIDKGLMWATATASEAMVEAKGVKDYLTESLKDSDYSEEKKKEIIGGAMRNTFLMNAALLGGTNIMEMNYLYKVFGKTEGAAKGIVQEGKLGSTFAREVGSTVPLGKLDRVLQSPVTGFLWSGAKGVAREGFVEENAQLAIQRMNQEYGLAGKVAMMSDLGDLGQRYLSQTGAALRGEDKEASMSIGLGGILGGIPTAIGDFSQKKRDKLTTDEAIKRLNLTQDNWLKFGNIYKTEVVDATDAAGNPIKQERIVLDDKKRPVEDIDKVNALATSMHLNGALLSNADNETSDFKRKLMRDTAFSQFVGAHIYSGTEDILFHKLDEAMNAEPEDLLKLGFDPSYDYKKQIREYKELAANIVKKNKLIGTDVMFDNSEVDLTRRKMLTDFVTQQAVYEKLAAETLNQSKEIADEFLKPPKGITTDSLVTQLNLLQQRIDSAEEAIEERKSTTGLEIPMQEKMSRSLIDELTKEKRQLELDNELSIKSLSRKKGGYYSYQGRIGATNPLLYSYKNKLKLHGELLNEARLAGLKFAKFADTRDGKNNFEEYRNFVKEEIVDPAIKAMEKAEKDRVEKDVEKAAASIKPGRSVKVNYKVNEEDEETLTGEIREGDRYKRVTLKTKTEMEVTILKITPDNKKALVLIRNLKTGQVTQITDFLTTILSLRDKEKWEKLKDLTATTAPGKRTVSTAPTAEDNEMGEVSNSEDDSIDPKLTPTDTGLAHSGIRPKWEEVKFNKTFGKHYVDDEDTVVNKEDGNDRFYRFTSKYSLLGGRYALQVITKDNDKLKIRRPDINPNDIKVVVVRMKANDEFEYIDENNEVIPDDKITKKNLVYSSLADINNWTVERVREMYTVGSKTTDEDIQEEIEKQKQFQKNLMDEVAADPDGYLLLDVDRVSPGIRKVEKNIDGTFSTNPVEGRIVVDNPDWSDLRSISNEDMNIGLRVSTDKSPIKGIKPGRAIMQEYKNLVSADGSMRKIWSDKVTQVFTRMMSNEEQEKYFNAVMRFSELMNKKYGSMSFGKSKYNFWASKKTKKNQPKQKPKGTPLTKAEQEEFDLILTWLKGVVLWSKPGANESKVRHVWISNGLHVGGETINPPLTNKNLKDNKKIILKEPYFNINRTYLQKNDPFQDIKIVNGKAVKDTQYSSYQEFLLAAREGGEAPPVYTSFPRYDSSIPQRKSAFIIWRNPNDISEKKDDSASTGTSVIRDASSTLNRTDRQINDFVNLKLNKILIEPNKKVKGARRLFIEREYRSDGKIAMYSVLGEGKSAIKHTRIFANEDEFLSNKNKIIENIIKATGYNISFESKKKGASLGDMINATLGRKPAQKPSEDWDQESEEDQEAISYIYPDQGDVFEDADGNRYKIINDTGGEDGDIDVQYRNLDTNEEGSWSRSEVASMIVNGDLVLVEDETSESEDELTDFQKKWINILKNNGIDIIQDKKDKDYDILDKEDGVIAERIATIEEAISIGEEFINDRNKARTSTPKGKTKVEATDIESAVNNAFVEGEYIVAELYMVNVTTGEKKLQVRASVKSSTGAIDNRIKNELRKNLISQLSTDASENYGSDAPFRIALTPEVQRTEDFQRLQQFMNANLPQFAVYRTNHLINGKAWGAFMNGAIYIYEKAEYGTGFHEAFEAVWASYLTNAEKSGLIDEFRSRTGTFFNPYSNQTKNYSEATDWDVKEMLADEFKDYVIHSGKMHVKAKEKTRSFFQGLWDMIRSIFNLPPVVREEMEDSINAVFKKITQGGFKQNTETGSGFTSTDKISEKNILGTEYAKVPGFTQKETSEIIEGLSYYFFLELFKTGKTIDTLLNGLNSVDSNKFFTSLYQESFNRVLQNLARVSPVKAEMFAKQGVYAGKMYEKFRKKLERYGVKFTELDDSQFNEDNRAEKNPLGIVDSISIDPRKMTELNVRLLLATLPDVNYSAEAKDYRVAYNEMLQPKLMDGDKVHNLLLNELSNLTVKYSETGTPIGVLEQMMDKLDKKYRKTDGTYKKGYGWIRNMKLRLKYSDVNGNRLDISSVTADDMKLRVGFIKSFTNVQYLPSKLIIGEDGLVYNISPLLNTNEKRIRETWANNLKIDILNKKNKIFKVDKSGNLVVNRTSMDYIRMMNVKNTQETTLDVALEMLDAIGIRFSATAEELKRPAPTIGTSPATEIIENARQIFNVIEEGDINNIENIFSRDKTGKVSGRINTLATIEADYSSEENLLSYMNAEGEMQYAVGISSLYGNMVNTLNSVNSLKELVITCPWLGQINEAGEVELNPYQQGSELLKPGGTLFTKNGKRNDFKLRFHILVGTGISEVDGENTAKLQFPERIALKISYLLDSKGSIGFTVINSDKNSEFGLGLPSTNSVTLKMSDIKNYVSVSRSEDGRKKKTADQLAVEEKIMANVIDRYINHLKDEMRAAVAYVEEENRPLISNYQDEVVKLGHFKDILSNEIREAFNVDVLKRDNPEEELGDIDRFIVENSEKIRSEIIAHINKQIDLTRKTLLQNDIFFESPDVLSEATYFTDSIDNTRLKEILGLTETQQMVEYKEGMIGSNWVELKNRTYFTSDQLDVIAAYLAINEELITTEQYKVVFGHPAMYGDIAKRASGSTGTKQPIVEDPDVLSFMDDNMARMDMKVRKDEEHQTIKVISFKDLDVVSLFHKTTAEAQYKDYLKNGMSKGKAEKLVGAKFSDDQKLIGYILDKKGKYTGDIKAYMSLNEADGMSFIMPDFLRDMLYLSSKFDSKMEAQWNYEMAYERLVRGGIIKNAKGETIRKKDPRYLPPISQEQIDADLVLVKKDPGYVFPVLKPQYFGYAKTKGLMHPVFLKHAVQPKFYRHIEGTQFESVYIASQNNEVDIIGFESGQKVGNITTEDGSYIPIYDKKGAPNTVRLKYRYETEDGDIDVESYSIPEELPQQQLYTRFYGIQVEQQAKTKKSSPRGSQITKVVKTNFYENGMPIKDSSGKPSKEIEKLITEYNDTLTKMIKLGKENLLKELGLVRYRDSYKVKDLTKLVSVLRKEAEERDLPDNVIDAIAVLDDGSLMYEFDTLINRDKIDNVLNSIVDSRVINEKMNGKISVQVASTLYEFKNRGYMILNDDGIYESVSDIESLSEEDLAKVKMTSSDLKFYRDENGKIQGMETYIAWPYTDVTPEQVGLKLVNGIYEIPKGGLKQLSSKLLEIVGFRIPTQGPNAIEAIVIKGFLPAANGDTIVVPSEIVGKAGSDFDIDKLFLYLPNAETFIGDKAFGSQEFKDFLKKDMISRGMSKADADTIIKNLKKEDYELINYSANNEYERESFYNVQYSLETLPKKYDDLTIRDREFIKKGIIVFKREYKGYKELRYIEPDDTSTKGLQNKFIELTRSLILHPTNYAQLVVPNSTATLKGLSEEIRMRREAADPNRVKPNEKSSAFLRSFVGSLTIRERYILAKRMVGISALHTTFHALAQVSGLRINSDDDYAPYYLTSWKNDKSNKSKEPTPSGIELKFDHHPANVDGTYNIGHRLDTDGNRISDAFSESTSGFVDGAKDPFVFDLNFSLDTAGVWFYLRHLGVPERQIAYFINQPIMDHYFREIAKNKSNFKKINGDSLSKEDVFYNVVTPYLERVTKNNLYSSQINSTDPRMRAGVRRKVSKVIDNVYRSYKKFDINLLEEGMLNGNLAIGRDNDFNGNLQIAVLAAYLRYEAQSQRITEFLQAITYDTQATKTIQENRYQETKWNRVRETGFIANPSAILDKTFLGEMKEQKEDITPMFRNFFITLEPEVQKVFEPLYERLDNKDYFITKDEALYSLNKYQTHVLNYILHTTRFMDSDKREKSINELYKEMFLGSNSMALRLQQFKDSDDPMISENLFVKELLPMMSTDANSPSNIRLFRNRLETYDINNIIESLENLRSYARDTSDRKLESFIQDLAKFVIIQSGVGTSAIDFKKVMSIDTYTSLVKKIFDTFKESGIELDIKQVWRTFHQNNYNNRMLVSKAPRWATYKERSLRFHPDSKRALHDYYVKYIPTVSREKLAKMVKNRENIKNVYKPVLFEKTSYTDEDGMIIYAPLDVMGDGRNSMEIHTSDEVQSVFEKNRFEKVFGSKTSSDEGWSRVVMNMGNVDLSAQTGPSKYLGGKGGFDAKGKGTPLGDGKDIAMRKDADSIIIELEDVKKYEHGFTEYDIEQDELGTSSSETSLLKVALKNDGVIIKDKHLHMSYRENPSVVMLARNKERGRFDLMPYTKQAILTMHQQGAEFILGDMPGVDDAYVKYLEQIGATYNIYYTGDQNRLNDVVQEYQDRNPPITSRFNSLEELMEAKLKNAKGKKGKKNNDDIDDEESPASLFNDSDKPDLTYGNYVLAVKESNRKKKSSNKPMSEELYKKMTEKQKQHLFRQLDSCK